MLAWVAFSLPLILVNGSYVLMVISDPFGWGWDLFGTAHVDWTPVVPEWTPYLQLPLLLAGLFFALKSGWAHALELFGSRRRALGAYAPSAVASTAIAIFFIRLYTA